MVRWLRTLWLALLSACGGGSAAGRDAALAPDAGQPDAGLAEVLFRAHVPDDTPPGDSIYLSGNFNGWDPAAPAYRMARVAPDVHELTLSFPLGTKLEFKLTRGSLATVERGGRGEDLPNRSFEVISSTTFDMRVGGWLDISPSTITGDVTTTSVPGFMGGRRVWVYLPPGYHDGTERYPVLYMLDGQNVFDRLTSFVGEWQVDETLERLIPAGEIAPIITIAVDHGGTRRIPEYTPWPDAEYPGSGEGEATLDAMVDVLVPWVDATYRTLPRAEDRAFAGSSLGGLMALYAVLTRPDVFGEAAALSPSIWWDGRHIVQLASQSEKPAARIWLDMGTEEDSLDELHAMRDALVALGFTLGGDLQVVEAQGAGHNEAAWSARFPDVVKFLFPPG